MGAWDATDEDQAAQIAAAMSGIPIRQQAIKDRQRRAQAMMATQQPQGATVGRTFVAASPLEHIAAAMTRYMGMRDAKQADADLAPLAQQAEQAGAAQGRLQRFDKNRDFGLKAREADLADMRAMSAESEAAAQAKFREQQIATQAAAQAEAARHNKSVEGLTANQQEQDSWGYGQDASGGGVLYNKKTGSIVPLTPKGPGVGAPYPGKGHDLERDVQSLGKDLEPVGQMKTDLGTLDAFIGKGEVPGFGPLAGRVPDVVASNDAIAARQAAKRIMAAYIQMRSGTAASDREVERLLAANGLGPTATPEAIKMGVTALRGQAAEVVGRMEAKYHPQVVSTYKGRGGVSKEAFVSGASSEDQAAKAWAEANANDTRAAEILQRLKAKGL